jgi:hypothetical protein
MSIEHSTLATTIKKMTQEEIYINDIGREIGGVVYSNDDRHLTQELQEYVMTKELMKPKLLPELFEALSKNKVNSSVWISGYYGSGKSHLLKMLSLVLNDIEIGGIRSSTVFSDKAKDDFTFQANIVKASKIKTKSILFNIQSKADGFNSGEGFTDRVLMVFLKALNESNGYHPIYPEIAEIERQLDQNGLFTIFKDNYFQQCNNHWELHRNDVSWHLNEFIEVYAKTRGISIPESRDIISQQRSNFKIDIESFARLVKTQHARDDQRIVFCVDEVGQFIADDIEKMLSLQTIAENLAAVTDGKALIIVTSQDDLDTTIGRFNQNQADTFSKIKARFLFRIPLTSANADEVIQKRILEKTEAGKSVLEEIYEKEKNLISTIFKFTHDSKSYKTFQSLEHFQSTFPFASYQFNLFQDSITELSKHDVFTGRSQSTGERSLISVCHTVAKQLKEKGLENIVTFPMMFDAIKHDFRSQVFSDITSAERGLLPDLAVDILKSLFLIKFIKGFKASLNNISILLLPKLDIDLGLFHKQVQESLNLLESQIYIQRNGNDLYEYLTNEEKAVESEIKHTEIEDTSPAKLLSEILFDEILKDSKFKLESNNQPYEFGRKLDDNTVGHDKDFYVNFITPLNSNSITTANINMWSAGRPNDLIVLLLEDSRLFHELRLIKKTEKYIQITNSPSLDSIKLRILSEKAIKIQDRKKGLLIHLKESIADAKMFLNGSELTDIGTRDPKTKITLGVQQLIKTIYTNLKMLTVDFTESHLQKLIQSQDDVLFKDTLHEIEIEVLNRIQRSNALHERTTTKSLIDHFAGRPYGWYQTAVLCIIAKLYKRNKISLKQDGNTLDDRNVLEALQKNNQYSNTIIELEEEIQNTQIQKLKNFYQEYFNEPNLGNEPKSVSRLFKDRVLKEVKDLSEIYSLRGRFRFLEAMGEPLSRLKLIGEKEHPYFFNALDKYQDDLLDDKENVLEVVKKFMNGTQKSIFENVLKFLDSNNANFDFIGSDNLSVLSVAAESPTPYKGALMQEAKAAMESIQKEVTELQTLEREIAFEGIGQSLSKLKSFEEFVKLSEVQQREITLPFEKLISDIQQERFIANIRTKANKAETDLYEKQLELMMRLANPPKPVEPGKPAEPPKPKIIFVRRDSVKVAYSKPALETRQDVEDYLGALKEQYLRIIDEDKRISL